MKKNLSAFILAACLLTTGCEAFSKAFAVKDIDKPENKWDGSGYKRSMGVGTGIDPQAREIERRLGYSNEGA